MKYRYIVKPCDDGVEFAQSNGRKRSRSWDVVDTTKPDVCVVANFDTRKGARTCAATMNNENAIAVTEDTLIAEEQLAKEKQELVEGREAVRS